MSKSKEYFEPYYMVVLPEGGSVVFKHGTTYLVDVCRDLHFDTKLPRGLYRFQVVFSSDEILVNIYRPRGTKRLKRTFFKDLSHYLSKEPAEGRIVLLKELD